MALTRRSFGLAAAGAALLPALPAGAKEAPAGTQAPGVYRMKVGAYEVTVLNDGSGALPTKYFSGDADGAAKLLENAFVASKEMAPTTFNAWLINTGDKLILVDTGYSNGAGPVGRPPAEDSRRGRRQSGRHRRRRHHPRSSGSLLRIADDRQADRLPERDRTHQRR